MAKASKVAIWVTKESAIYNTETSGFAQAEQFRSMMVSWATILVVPGAWYILDVAKWKFNMFVNTVIITAEISLNICSTIKIT